MERFFPFNFTTFSFHRYLNHGENGTNNTQPYCYDGGTGSTVLQGLTFGGIPTILVLNLIGFVIILVLFCIIRKKCWDYGRVALMSDSESVPGNRYRSSTSFASEEEERDSRFWSWIVSIFKMKEEEISERCGEDAIHYLSFQRHIIYILLVVGFLSMAVILPVNLFGAQLDVDHVSFMRTTIVNLKHRDNLLWLHITFAVLYLIVTVLFMGHQSSTIKYKDEDTVKHTLLISGLPRDVNKEIISKHFSEAYPEVRVEDVFLCYDVADLICISNKRKKAEKSLVYFTNLYMKHGKHILINPKPCGQFCCCEIRGCEREDAIKYYARENAKLSQEYAEKLESVFDESLGVAFVTFAETSMATLILNDYNAIKCQGWISKPEPQPSQYSKVLQTSYWNVKHATYPENILWGNMSVQGAKWWFRWLIINLCLFVVLFFLTTPSMIITTMDRLNITRPIYYLNKPIVSQLFPTVLLWAFSSWIPSIVYYVTLLDSHWTKSSLNCFMMHKVYYLLLFMVLILPSLGLTSLNVLFRWLFDKALDVQGPIRLECVFHPHQGAFFVNYVIASALIGNGMELLRLPGLLLYTMRMIVAKSAGERQNLKQHQAFDYEFGVKYARMLSVFTVIMTFSITCPIIVPFGIMYMVLKHLVDRHNLFYAYLPTKLDKNIHFSAVNQALIAPILCLLWLFFYSLLRVGFNAVSTQFTLIIIFSTVFVYILYTCLGCFQHNSTMNYKTEKSEPQTDAQNDPPTGKFPMYIPSALNPSSSRTTRLEGTDREAMKDTIHVEEIPSPNMEDSVVICIEENGTPNTKDSVTICIENSDMSTTKD